MNTNARPHERVARRRGGHGGRPAGRLYGETIPVRLTREMIAAIEKWAANNDLSRSEAIRALIERGLKKQVSGADYFREGDLSEMIQRGEIGPRGWQIL